jgi:hypothetical protein
MMLVAIDIVGAERHSETPVARRLLIAILAAFLLRLVPTVMAQDAKPDNSSRCSALESIDLSAIQDARTQITKSNFEPSAGDRPAYCRALGYVEPNIGIEIWLPALWNGKLLEIGCAGYCGTTLNSNAVLGCAKALRKGYACIASDQGHRGTLVDTLWAHGNIQAQVDFAFRATHVVALAGKAITSRYYDQPLTRAYFTGCSSGGLQGLMEAQRFPSDFDGIVVGAPGQDNSAIYLNGLWEKLASVNSQGNPIFGASSLRTLHNAALAACDMDDGVKDGIISNPRACHFDPATLICRAHSTATCLSSEQVDAAKKIYEGPTTSNGQKLYSRGPMPGAELTFPQTAGDGQSVFDSKAFRFFAFASDPGPSWKVGDFNFDEKRLEEMGALNDATNPDLSRFKGSGGKLILYQGWADGSVPPLETVNYYENVEKVMGGRGETSDLVRLFMIPGMAHCFGGAGANDFDFLSYLEEWVENGRAPDKIIGAHIELDEFLEKHSEPWTAHPERAEGELSAFLLDPKSRVFTRPVFPYPVHSRYRGTGDPKKAENFEASER